MHTHVLSPLPYILPYRFGALHNIFVKPSEANYPVFNNINFKETHLKARQKPLSSVKDLSRTGIFCMSKYFYVGQKETQNYSRRTTDLHFKEIDPSPFRVRTQRSPGPTDYPGTGRKSYYTQLPWTRESRTKIPEIYREKIL